MVFRARADEVRGESLQFKRGELIKFRKRGMACLPGIIPVKKKLSGARKVFFIVISVSALWGHARLFQDFRICSTVKPLFKNPLH